MDDAIFGLWNGWSFASMILLSFLMAEIGNLCSRKGQSQWYPPLMFVAGILVTLIYAHSGGLTLLLSIPITLILTLLISKIMVPRWDTISEERMHQSHSRQSDANRSRVMD